MLLQGKCGAIESMFIVANSAILPAEHALIELAPVWVLMTPLACCGGSLKHSDRLSLFPVCRFHGDVAQPMALLAFDTSV